MNNQTQLTDLGICVEKIQQLESQLASSKQREDSLQLQLANSLNNSKDMARLAEQTKVQLAEKDRLLGLVKKGAILEEKDHQQTKAQLVEKDREIERLNKFLEYFGYVENGVAISDQLQQSKALLDEAIEVIEDLRPFSCDDYCDSYFGNECDCGVKKAREFLAKVKGNNNG